MPEKRVPLATSQPCSLLNTVLCINTLHSSDTESLVVFSTHLLLHALSNSHLIVPPQEKSSLLLPLPTWLIPAHLLADLTSSNSGNTMSPFRQLTPTGLSNPAHLHICLLNSMLLDIDRVCLARLGPLCSVVLKCRPTLITLSLCWRVTVRIKLGGHKVHRRYSRTFAGYAQDGLMVEGEKPIKIERDHR